MDIASVSGPIREADSREGELVHFPPVESGRCNKLNSMSNFVESTLINCREPALDLAAFVPAGPDPTAVGRAVLENFRERNEGAMRNAETLLQAIRVTVEGYEGEAPVIAEEVMHLMDWGTYDRLGRPGARTIQRHLAKIRARYPELASRIHARGGRRRLLNSLSR